MLLLSGLYAQIETCGEEMTSLRLDACTHQTRALESPMSTYQLSADKVNALIGFVLHTSLKLAL